jgi:hypothetical protein
MGSDVVSEIKEVKICAVNTIFASNKLMPELLNAETALKAPSHLSSC